MEGNPYKFDPKLMKKAEGLLNGARTTSLDNTDLTITSLNYIDEYQNTINGRNLQNLYVKAEPERKWVDRRVRGNEMNSNRNRFQK